jgi:hypothetical protein
VAGLIVVATAALVVGLLALTRPATPTTPSRSQITQSATDDTTDADKALCSSIAPLMKRSVDERNGFVHAGPTGSPERDAALPKFVDDTKQWAKDAQQSLDSAPGSRRLLTRTLQRYIDDMLLYVEGIRAGRETKYDDAAWVDATEIVNGPLTICYHLGVTW